jgi:DNA invertase Pin-like site-specific DNA recombinase
MVRARKKRPGSATVAVLYVRASKDSQELSPEAQRAACEAWCTSRGVTLAATFEEHVCSVEKLEKRQALLDAIDALPVHGAGILLVAKRDRLARDPVLMAMIERLAERNGAHVVSAAGEGNGEGPSDKLMRSLIDAFAAYELALIRSRTKAALAGAFGPLHVARKRCILHICHLLQFSCINETWSPLMSCKNSCG